MSYAVWTWVAIGILVLGAPLVFLWFLREAGDLLGGFRRSRKKDAERETRSR